MHIEKIKTSELVFKGLRRVAICLFIGAAATMGIEKCETQNQIIEHPIIQEQDIN